MLPLSAVCAGWTVCQPLRLFWPGTCANLPLPHASTTLCLPRLLPHAHPCRRVCPCHSSTLLQPAVRDFNEEDYMDGDLMDEELVE